MAGLYKEVNYPTSFEEYRNALQIGSQSSFSSKQM